MELRREAMIFVQEYPVGVFKIVSLEAPSIDVYENDVVVSRWPSSILNSWSTQDLEEKARVLPCQEFVVPPRRRAVGPPRYQRKGDLVYQTYDTVPIIPI
jgi:hypothetical protein